MPAAKIVSHADSVSPLQYFRNSGMRTICCVSASTSPTTLADHPPKIRRARLEVKDVTRPLRSWRPRSVTRWTLTAGVGTEPYCAGPDQTRTLTGRVNRSACHSGARFSRVRQMFARAAHCDVTPRDRPVRLAGFASRQTPVSAILDPIEISALLLEGGNRRCLILGFDLMIVGAELVDLIHTRLGRLGFGPNEVMMLASHTHCAPA